MKNKVVQFQHKEQLIFVYHTVGENDVKNKVVQFQHKEQLIFVYHTVGENDVNLMLVVYTHLKNQVQDDIKLMANTCVIIVIIKCIQIQHHTSHLLDKSILYWLNAREE